MQAAIRTAREDQRYRLMLTTTFQLRHTDKPVEEIIDYVYKAMGEGWVLDLPTRIYARDIFLSSLSPEVLKRHPDLLEG